MKFKNFFLYFGFILSTILFIGIDLGHTTTIAEAATYKTYKISTKTIPVDKKYTKSKNYNTNTKHYYMLKSYLEKLEKDGGGTLVLEKGTYQITNTLCIPSNVTIRLRKGTVLKKISSTKSKNLKASDYLFYIVAPSKQNKKNCRL